MIKGGGGGEGVQVIKKTQTLAYEQLSVARWQAVRIYRFEESQPFEHQWRKGECLAVLSITPGRLGHTAGILTRLKEEESSLTENYYTHWIWLHSCKCNSNKCGDLRSEKWWGTYGLGSRNEAAWGSEVTH